MDNNNNIEQFPNTFNAGSAEAGPAPFAMLTTAVLSRFGEPVAVPVDKVNKGAVFNLRAISRTYLLNLAAKHSICPDCGGKGTAPDINFVYHTCAKCGGKKPRTWADAAVRLEIVRYMLPGGWNGVLVYDTATKGVVNLPYSDDVRDSLAETPVFDVLFAEATALTGRVEATEGKA